MLECVFTTQKTKKKKKWEDGFIEKVGRGIVLYNEEKKKIFKGERYKKTEEDYLDFGQYFVYCELFEGADDDKSIDNESENGIDHKSTNHKNVVENSVLENSVDCKNEISDDQEINDIDDKTVTNGRSNNEILDLFNK